jgi:hypothetical protein
VRVRVRAPVRLWKLQPAVAVRADDERR